jgi:hypothetical protein
LLLENPSESDIQAGSSESEPLSAIKAKILFNTSEEAGGFSCGTGASAFADDSTCARAGNENTRNITAADKRTQFLLIGIRSRKTDRKQRSVKDELRSY